MNKKILIISTVYYPYHMGGAEVSTQILAEGLMQTKKYEVHILTHNTKNLCEDVNGVKVIRHNYGIGTEDVFSGIINGKKSTKLKKFISRSKDIIVIKKYEKYYSKLFKDYDLIIASGNCVKMGIRSIWNSAYICKIPFVQILRDPILLYFLKQKPYKFGFVDSFYRRILSKDFSRIRYIVSPSKALIMKHIKNGMIINNYKVIPNTVNDGLCNSIESCLREDYILYVGVINRNKGCHTLIEAFCKISNKYSKFKLKLIGKIDGITIPSDKNIEYLGHMEIKEVYKYMAKAKIVVLPSEWEEAFGRVIVEAVFNHTIAIGSDSGGIPEIFDGDSRFLFKRGNIEELSNKLEYFMSLEITEYNAILSELLVNFDKYRIKEHIRVWDRYITEIVNRKNL